MKITEKHHLKRTILQLKRYATDNVTAREFYDNLDTLNIESMQDLSFNNDLKFFKEVNFILSVIISIVMHPHISNTTNNIILRSDQVGSIPNDMFLKTMKDASLWKHNKQKEMIPEYVHYYENIDLIRIYENIFIVMLINLLSSELSKYNEFYTSMILTYQGVNELSLSDDNVQVAFEYIESLTKKIRKIKNTYFYKTITAGGNCNLRHITPTNILLKDRLYNYCFKFYRQMISYEDLNALQNDFMTYYYVLLLKQLKSRKFELLAKKDSKKMKNRKSVVITNELTLANEDFKVVLSFDKFNQAIALNITNEIRKKMSFNHLLVVDSLSTSSTLEDTIKNSDFTNYETVQILTLWNIGIYKNNKFSFIKQNPVTEDMLMAQYVNDHLLMSKGSKKIYSTFCPICKNKSVNENDDGVLICSNCGSSYIFKDSKKEDETMWFIKIKR